MAKSKYNKDTFPELAEGYAREGLTDKQIWKKLGISRQTFYNYQEKYVEFFEALKRGKKPVDFEVEKALLKRCLGYEKEKITEEVTTDGAGNILKKHKNIELKHYPPEVSAIQTWLSNRKNDKWKRNPDIHNSKDEDQMVEFEVIKIKGNKIND